MKNSKKIMKSAMNWIKAYKSLKSFVKSFLIAVIILVALEIFFRSLNIDVGLKERFSDQDMIAIYGQENLADYKKVFKEQGVPWIYKPFVEFIEVPRDGDFVSVSDDNIRCNINGDNSCIIKSGKQVIWIFGGSTTFGYGVKNNETIASYLNAMMPDYEVINFGQAAYYSTSENILFNSFLSQGLVPEIAIFIDGLNDYYFYQTPDRSVASDSINDRLSNDIETLSDRNKFIKFVKNIARNFELVLWINNKLKSLSDNDNQVYEIQTDEIIKKVEKRLKYNFLSRVAIADVLNFKVINVLQPVPSYGVGHKTSLVPEELVTLNRHLNSGRGYELIDRSNLGRINIDFLDMSLLEISDPMYIDTVHYSSQTNEEIAARLYKLIQEYK